MQDIPQTPGSGRVDDLSALTWVHAELRRSLEAAHKALRRYLKEAEATQGADVDSVDPAVLRAARAQLHQGVGALELVGLPAVAGVLRASEAAVQRMSARPAMVDAQAVATIERVSFALLDFLARQLAGKPVSPVMLFPQFRAALQLAGADRVHPADLWGDDWQWRDLPADPSATPRPSDDAVRGTMETLVLALMRHQDSEAQARMSDLCADLGAGVRQQGGPAHLATFWQLAAAVFEAQARALLASNVYTKRVASRLLAQLRMGERGHHEISDRLAQDLLFFCSQASEPDLRHPAPRLAAVRQAWRLGERPVADYETSRLGRFDPALLIQARKRVAQARDSWSAVAGGEQHRLGSLTEQFALVGESLRLLFPGGAVLAEALQSAVAQTVAADAEPAATLAMEVATGILYLDASLEDGELDDPELEARVQRLARRIDDVRIGADAQPLDMWMEELYRRVSDRQTMGSVVQELRASLSEVEKQIDHYFRNPAAREVLIPVPAQLSAMRGVLSVLGMGHASQAVLRMRDDVDALAQTEVDPQRAIQAGTFDRLADNLGALGFLIDMISVQPQLAKSLFRFDPETGSLSAVMGQTERTSAFAEFDVAGAAAPPPARTPPLLGHVRALSDAAAGPGVGDADLAQRIDGVVQQALADEQPELARLLGSAAQTLRSGEGEAARQALRGELAAALASLQGVEPEAPAAPAAVPPPRPAPPGGTGLEDDPEMRDIFIEEAGEVIAGARAAFEHLAETPDSALDMTTLRRAFHTLKGSSRMVGLRGFGEAAWASEQLYNVRLAQAAHMDAPLRGFTAEALDYLAGWVEAIAAASDRGHHSGAVARAADALRLDDVRMPIEPPAGAPEPAETETALPVAQVEAELPFEAMADLQFALSQDTAPASPEPEEVAIAEGVEPAPALDFDFDLVGDDVAPTATETLLQRVPELPTAADLDLDLDLDLDFARPEPVPEPHSMELPSVEELSFDLDLGAFDEAVRGEPTAEPPALPSDAEDATGPDAPPHEPATEASTVPPEPFAPAEDASAAPEVEVPEFEAAPEAAVEPALPVRLAEEEEQVKVIGPLRIGIPLFNIFLNEADELSRRLVTELAEWALEHERHAVPESCVALAHSLAGNSATVGYGELSALARALEHALARSHAQGHGRSGESALFSAAAEEIRRLLHQFAAGFLHGVPADLMEGLAEHERLPMETLPEVETSATGLSLPGLLAPLPPRPVPASVPLEGVGDDEFDAVDAIDGELFPIFEDEAEELLPQLQARLREWWVHPGDAAAPAACMRTLHTFKGGARLAGAMRLGEMAHRLETVIAQLGAHGGAQAGHVEQLLARGDAMAAAFAALRARPAMLSQARSPVSPAVVVPFETPAPEALRPLTDEPAAVVEGPAASAPAGIDWGRFPVTTPSAPEATEPVGAPAAVGSGGAAVRVRAGLLDRLVNQAGEVSITRARIDADVKLLQGSLGELTDSLERMRRQLRDIELQAETQIATRIEAAKAAAQSFDPLEMDRFTRFQELTRFMAESVNDVATLQRSLQRTLQSAEDELAAQARLTRELQDDLLRTRMVEFESLADRLYRTVRQAARDSGKQVRLDIVGGAIEVDRGVLERMAGPFEHLLRNAVAHGIELPELRQQAGKDANGLITISVAQAGNEVALDFSDDGAGLDAARIRARAVERGLLESDAHASEAELAEFIFSPGFSTAQAVTELAGRGVGLDVVRAEVVAMGGRIETASTHGQGTRMRLLLPLTTAVTQVVMLRCGDLHVAVPSPLIEIVRRVPTAEVERGYAAGSIEYDGAVVPFYWMAALLGGMAQGAASGRTQTLVVVRSAAQRVAVHVDEVLGNQEVVVKNVGPQLSRLPGLAGVTLLPSGSVAPIYNPVALAAVYGAGARACADGTAPPAAALARAPEAPRPPMVMVVDDSLTVRRVTQRLLVREGYRVVTAKDGMEALEKLAQERPVVLLSDIEMPRMDGFDLLRNVRADLRLAGLPVVMITSRIAQKHRDYAAELGADHYLGKPYSEDELLQIVASYAAAGGADIPT